MNAIMFENFELTQIKDDAWSVVELKKDLAISLGIIIFNPISGNYVFTKSSVLFLTHKQMKAIVVFMDKLSNL